MLVDVQGGFLRSPIRMNWSEAMGVLTVALALLGFPFEPAIAKSVPPQDEDSCMYRWVELLPSSAGQAKDSRLAERYFSQLAVPVDESNVKTIDLGLVAALLGGRQRADEFRACLTRGSELCRANAPCRNGGRCLFISSSIQHGYQCSCPEGTEGRFCEAVTSPCHTNPCRNGGTCHVNGSSYTCCCPPHVSGDQCQNKWFNEKQFTQLKQAVVEVTHGLKAIQKEVMDVRSDNRNHLESFLQRLEQRLSSKLISGLDSINSTLHEHSAEHTHASITSTTTQSVTTPSPTTLTITNNVSPLVFDANAHSSRITLSNGGATAAHIQTPGDAIALGNRDFRTGKHQWSMRIMRPVGEYTIALGVADYPLPEGYEAGHPGKGWYTWLTDRGSVFGEGVQGESLSSSITQGETVLFTLDLDRQTLTARKKSTGETASITGVTVKPGKSLRPMVYMYYPSHIVEIG